MGHIELAGCLETDGGTLERVRFFPRQLRRLMIYGGLGVLPKEDAPAQSPLARLGYGVRPRRERRADLGDALAGSNQCWICPRSVWGRDLRSEATDAGPGALWTRSRDGSLRTRSFAQARRHCGRGIFVAIEYAECLSRPIRALSAGCGCEDEACEYSRVRDSFQIECLIELRRLTRHSLTPHRFAI